MSWALILCIRFLVVRAAYARFGAGVKSHFSERDALRTSSGIRASNSSEQIGTEIALDFAIVNSAGDDVSKNVSVFYHQPALISRFTKRTASRPIRDCPDGHDFLFSRCSRFHSVAQWSLVCRARPGVPAGSALQWGECRADEICVEGRSGVHREREGYYASNAWCVDQENFVQIARLLANGRSTGGSVQTGFRPTTGQQYSVQAVLAQSDSRTPLIAQSLEIQAQTTDLVGNVQTWRTLNAGDNQCNNCASIGILEVPDGTQRIKTHIEVKPGTIDGLLYLASVGV